MIILECEQGSVPWVEARLGIPTASEFSKVVTPGGKLSASRRPYLGKLVAEWALGDAAGDIEFGGTAWTERGQILEPKARKAYAFTRDVDPVQVGFVYRDETRLSGCSPDGLVGPDGLLELKCPMAGTHLTWLAQDVVPREHQSQLQGQLWVSQRDWVDFMSFYPGLPPFLVRVAPDPTYQRALDLAIPQFIDEVLAARERLQALGVTPYTPYQDSGGASSETAKREPPPSAAGVSNAAEAAFTRSSEKHTKGR